MHRFIDTNVLIYATSPAPDEAGKQRVAQRLLNSDDLALSVQVLQEFYAQTTRPTRPGRLTPEQAQAFIEAVSRFPVQEVTLDIFRAAVVISQRFQLSYWDGAILAAAHALGCDVVYSEDLSDEQDYDGVRIINPFAVSRRAER